MAEEKRNFITVYHNHELDFVIWNQVQCKNLRHTRYDIRQNIRKYEITSQLQN